MTFRTRLDHRGLEISTAPGRVSRMSDADPIGLSLSFRYPNSILRITEYY